MKKIFKGLLVAMVLMSGAYASMSSGVAGQEKVKIGESENDKFALLLIRKFIEEKGDSFKVSRNGVANLAGLKAEAQAWGEIYTLRLGRLQDNVQSLGIPSGTINRTLDWATLFHNTVSYTRASADAYDYLYRLYRLSTLRMLVQGGPDGELQLALMMAADFESDTEAIKILDQGERWAVRKAFFNWILFAGTMLDPMADDSFAKEYFAEEGISQEWERMRQLIEIVKKENGGK